MPYVCINLNHAVIVTICQSHVEFRNVVFIDLIWLMNLDKLSFSHQSWDSAASAGDHNRCSSTSTGEELIEIAPSPKLKRHNSLKLIRQRDLTVKNS